MKTAKEKLIHQLFVGKMADIIGVDRVAELLRECKKAFEATEEYRNQPLQGTEQITSIFPKFKEMSDIEKISYLINENNMLTQSLAECDAKTLQGNKTGEWISVEDKLPKVNDNVLGFTKNGRRLITWIDKNGGFDINDIDEEDCYIFWHPLPSSPTEGKEETK